MIASHLFRPAALLLAFVAAPLSWGESIRIVQPFPPGTSNANAMKGAAEKLRSVTEGRISIEWTEIKMEDAGATPDLLGDLMSGRSQMVALPTMAFAAEVEEAVAYGLPMLFRDERDLQRADEAVGARLDAAFREAGLVTIARVDRGFANVFSIGPIETPEDLRESRLWLPDSPAFTSLGEVISTKTVHASFGDLKKHLLRAKAGDVDAANTLIIDAPTAINLGWHEIVTHVLMTPVFPLDLRMVMTRSAYDQITEADRKVLADEMTRAFEQVRAQSATATKTWPRTLKRFVTAHRPTGDAAKAWTTWGTAIQDQQVLERPRAAALLAEIRKALGGT